MTVTQVTLLQHRLASGKVEKQRVVDMEDMVKIMEDVKMHLEMFEEGEGLSLVKSLDSRQ